MKKKLLLLPFILGLIYVVASSNHTGVGASSHVEATGATSTTGCSGGACHGSASSSTSVTLTLDSAIVGTTHYPVTHYIAGHSYYITITGVNTSTTATLPKFGFQLTAVRSAGAGTSAASNAGTLATSGLPAGCSNVNVTVGSGSINVVEHNTWLSPASGTGSTGTTYTESIPWTAPGAFTGTIILYGSLNAVNFGSTSAGDLWNTTNTSITELIPAAAVGAITGPSTVCVGATITLTDTPAGGVWTCAPTSIATITPVSGVLTGVATGSAVVTYTTSSGSATTTITVAAGSTSGTISSSTGSAFLCQGHTFTLSTTGTSGGTWSGGSIYAFISASTGSGTAIATGTTSFTYTVTGSCGTVSSYFPVTIVSSPVAGTIAGSTPLCVGGGATTYTVTGSTGTGAWSMSNTTVATIDPSTGIATPTAGGIDTVLYIVSTACGSDTAIFPITVVTGSGAGTISGPTTVCTGSTIGLSESATSGTWSVFSTSIATIDASTGVVTGVSPGTDTVYYTISSSCGTAISSYVITVISSGSPGTISGSSLVCAGVTISLSTSGTGGTWSSSLSSVATVSSSGNVTAVSGGSAVISYTVASGGCAPVSATFPIVVVAPPSSGVISGPTSVCVGSTISLTDTTSGGVWSSVTPSVATVSISSGVVTGVTAGTDTIKYSVGGTCGTSYAYYVITVNAAPVSGTISGPSTICTGGTGTLTSTGASASGVWSSTTTSVATIGATSGVVGGASSGTSVITYTVSSASCGLAVSTFTITVTSTPSAGAITGPSTVCEGSTINLVDGTTGGTWSSGSTSNATVTSTGVVTGVSAGTATISYVVTTSCGTATATFPVTINPLPFAGAIIGGSSVCEGATLSLSTTSSGGSWSSTSTSNATVDASGNVTGVLAGTTTISYTVTNSCGTDAATKSITINPLPIAGTISGSSSICIGSPITLSSSVGGGSWTSSTTSVATVDAAGLVTGVSTGSSDISYSVVNGCGTAVATFTVNVSPATSAGTISGAGNVCVGASTSFTPSVTGGTWSCASSGIATVDATGNVTGISAGTETITYTVTSSCGSVYTTASILVRALPVTGTISGTATLCNGAFTPLSETTSGGTWSSGTTSIATINSSGVVFAVTAGNVIISYGVTNSCGTYYATYNVTVETTPTGGTISGPSTLCVGTTITLTDGVAGGTWSSLDPSTASVDASGNVTGVALGTTTISYSVINTCSSADATFSVTVNSIASAGTISGPTTVCEGSTISLTDATGGGTWTSGSTSVATVDASGVVTGVSGGTAVISYTVVSSCGTAVAPYTITVNPLPNSGSIAGAATVCTGTSTTLTDAAGGGTWTSTTTSAATVDASGNVFGVAVGSTVISYTVTNSCGTSAATHAVTVNATPVAGTISGSSSVCAGGSVTLTETVTGGTWSSTASGVASISTGGVVTSATAGSTTISYTVTTACGTAAATFAFTVNPMPNAGSIAGSASVCTGTTTTLTDAATGGSWSSTVTSVATVDASGVVTGIAPGTTSILYSVTNGCGTATTSQTETVILTPSAAAITGPSFVCAGAGIALSETSTGGTWSSSATSVATVDASGNVTGVAGGSANIMYTITNACGTSVATQAITVGTTPSIGAISGPSSVCTGATVTLSDAFAGGVWSSSTSSVATVNSSTGVVTGVSAGSATITYTISGACGSASVLYSMTVNAVPSTGTISGPTSVCPGVVISLTESVSGGTWSSSVTSFATVSSTGDVTGVSAGTVVISYGVSGICGTNYATYTVTVNPSPYAGVISGPTSLCAGASMVLIDATTGGTWSSGGPSIATVDAAGTVTGVSGGTVNIIYSVTNVCGTVSAAQTITVLSLPSTGIITGATRICQGSTTALACTVGGPAWTASNGHATISTAGILTAISGGIDTIYHSVTNSCGTASASFIDTIDMSISATAFGGPDTICQGDTIHKTAGVPWGNWSASNTHAFVSMTGDIIGVTPGWDTLHYTVVNSCGTSSAILRVYVRSTAACSGGGGAGVGQPFEATSISVYPNPSNGSFTISVPVSLKDATITIMDVFGKVIETRAADKNNTLNAFNLSNLAAGSYMIRVNTADQTFRDKIVIW